MYLVVVAKSKGIDLVNLNRYNNKKQNIQAETTPEFLN